MSNIYKGEGFGRIADANLSLADSDAQPIRDRTIGDTGDFSDVMSMTPEKAADIFCPREMTQQEIRDAHITWLLKTYTEASQPLKEQKAQLEKRRRNLQIEVTFGELSLPALQNQLTSEEENLVRTTEAVGQRIKEDRKKQALSGIRQSVLATATAMSKKVVPRGGINPDRKAPEVGYVADILNVIDDSQTPPTIKNGLALLSEKNIFQSLGRVMVGESGKQTPWLKALKADISMPAKPDIPSPEQASLIAAYVLADAFDLGSEFSLSGAIPRPNPDTLNGVENWVDFDKVCKKLDNNRLQNLAMRLRLLNPYTTVKDLRYILEDLNACSVLIEGKVGLAVEETGIEPKEYEEYPEYQTAKGTMNLAHQSVVEQMGRIEYSRQQIAEIDPKISEIDVISSEFIESIGHLDANNLFDLQARLVGKDSDLCRIFDKIVSDMCVDALLTQTVGSTGYDRLSSLMRGASVSNLRAVFDNGVQEDQPLNLMLKDKREAQMAAQAAEIVRVLGENLPKGLDRQPSNAVTILADQTRLSEFSQFIGGYESSMGVQKLWTALQMMHTRLQASPANRLDLYWVRNLPEKSSMFQLTQNAGASMTGFERLEMDVVEWHNDSEQFEVRQENLVGEQAFKESEGIHRFVDTSGRFALVAVRSQNRS